MNRRRKAQPERSSLKLKTPTRSTLHHENTIIFNRSKTFDFPSRRPVIFNDTNKLEDETTQLGEGKSSRKVKKES
ncbi:hypothetical protein Bca52824_044366 [Brassica carinata]|uniref:Uncharacterized protein n=1 Tax=Brassica carinata TaxID=52824 RepID=A0A8X7S0W0_BRACI|nr:hypothetical protein Bca52824_044366 [Brassica carinata]